jgi:hypothetical protein
VGTRLRRSALVASIALALAACSPPAAPRAAPSPVLPAHPTAQQYGRALTTSIRSIESTWQQFTGAGCGSDRKALMCELSPATLDQEAGTLALQITNAQDTTSPAYLGPPPPQIARLVTDTQAAARRVCDDLDATAAPGPDWAPDARALVTELGGWTPYL